MAQYRMGLKDAVEDLMIRDKPATLSELIKIAIDVDDELHRRRLEKQGYWPAHGIPPRSTTTFPASASTTTNATATSAGTAVTDGPVPMDIASLRHGPLSDEERARRRINGLCFYCGKEGHRQAECNDRSARPPPPAK
ncbi:hypothetical protein DFJ74DRAFT_642485 [Hyaloraphidium curvatum]|nr:hypothetical protein DFJ74DRAFT_642485 [Hyaloraphidium curvatum]